MISALAGLILLATSAVNAALCERTTEWSTDDIKDPDRHIIGYGCLKKQCASACDLKATETGVACDCFGG